MVAEGKLDSTVSIQEASSLVDLSVGQFSAYYRQGHRMIREKIFLKAALSLRKTDTPYCYSLVVTSIHEDEPLPTHHYAHEQPFLVDARMELMQDIVFEKGKNIALTWVDKASEEAFEFICEQPLSQDQTDEFIFSAYQCMYEHANQQPRQCATEHDLQQFIKPSAEPRVGSKVLNRTIHGQIESTEHPLLFSSSSKLKRKFPTGKTLPSQPSECLSSIQGKLSMYRTDQNAFVENEEIINVELVQLKPYEYWMSISGDTTTTISQPIRPVMNPMFERGSKTFAWNYFEEDHIYSFLLRFLGDEAYDDFLKGFGQCLYESSSQVPFSRSTKSDQDYVISAYDFTSDNKGDDASSVSSDEQEYTLSWLNFDEDEQVLLDSYNGLPSQLKRHDSINSLIACSSKGKSYMIRGNTVDVFQQTDNGMSYDTSLLPIKDLSGDLFTPHQAMLYQSESALLLRNSQAPHKVLKLDLERGQVVEEWQIGSGDKNDAVVQLAPRFKYAGQTDEPTAIGLTSQSLFKVDPRLSTTNKIVQSECKHHLTKTAFSAMATTQSGHVAVGSHKGDIRLFEQLSRAARTSLHSLGDPIIALDVTASGRYILATCKSYLALIDVMNHSESAHRLGFESTLRTGDRPVRYLLKLRPEHAVLMEEATSFTAATFNTGEEERYIVTSTGSYIITWSLDNICKGKIYDYRMQKFDCKVNNSVFQPGGGTNLTVTLPKNVLALQHGRLCYPSTQFFTSPSPFISSRAERRSTNHC